MGKTDSLTQKWVIETHIMPSQQGIVRREV